jgi:N utilization substance protein B
MGKRTTARKLAMQALYQYQIQKGHADEIIAYTLGDNDFIPDTRDFAAAIFAGVIAHDEFINNLIVEYSIDWKIDRIAHIDKAILRVAIWELLFTDSSVKVIIAEAIELISKYSVYEAIKFVNGILGGIAKNREDLQQQVAA